VEEEPLMSDATDAFFEELRARGHEPRLRNVTGTVRFDITQDGSTTLWWLAIDKGDLRVSTGEAGTDSTDPDCVIKTRRSLFDEIATGQVNALAAMLRGDVIVAGDPELLVAVQPLFPPPPARRRGQANRPRPEGGGSRER
jgi:SCP-2 sterol transfer family